MGKAKLNVHTPMRGTVASRMIRSATTYQNDQCFVGLFDLKAFLGRSSLLSAKGVASNLSTMPVRHPAPCTFALRIRWMPSTLWELWSASSASNQR